MTEYVSRASLKQLIADGQAKLAEGKVFCLTYHYLNTLKKAYFRDLRASHDALDHAMVDERLPEVAGSGTGTRTIRPE